MRVNGVLLPIPCGTEGGSRNTDKVVLVVLGEIIGC